MALRPPVSDRSRAEELPEVLGWEAPGLCGGEHGRAVVQMGLAGLRQLFFFATACFVASTRVYNSLVTLLIQTPHGEKHRQALAAPQSP